MCMPFFFSSPIIYLPSPLLPLLLFTFHYFSLCSSSPFSPYTSSLLPPLLPLSSQLDGNSHVVYGEEEAAGTRLLIGGKPCLLQVLFVAPFYHVQ